MATKANQGEELRLPFRPRARILQLLGDQLIGTPRLAVFELVKNAYDADAENVTITLDGIDTSSPSITVEDDGDGMTLETIKNIWMVPAHDHREAQRRSLRRTRLNRLPLGEKGLGRFAVHKLGDRIELITRASRSLECVVAFDWEQLIDKPFLSDANVRITTRSPEYFKGQRTGTRLQITQLREKKWDRGEVRRLLSQITSISSPFTERSDTFNASLLVPEHPDWVEGIPDIEVLLRRAPWHFRFTFSSGKFDWKYEFRGVTGIKVSKRQKSERGAVLQIPEDRDADDEGVRTRSRHVIADQKFAEGIGPVSGELYVFDRDRVVLSKLGDSQLVQKFLDQNGGIRVYRDGIRVYNYGETGDDWLGLDLRRVNTPTRNISRNIVVGAVDLILQESVKLTEKTNREGFVENDAYRRLKRIVLGAMATFEIERKQDKEKIREVTGKGHDPEVVKISQPLDALRKAAARHRLSKELEPLIDKAETTYNEMRDAMLRVGLSGVGLAIVFHEIEQGVRVLYNAIEGGGKLELVKSQAGELVRLLDGFSELLRKGDRKTNSLQHLIRRVRDLNTIRFRNHGVRLECPALEDASSDIRSVFSFGLLLGALNNLLDNAIYWLQVRWPEESKNRRSIYININTDLAEGPAIVVADNGPGFQDAPESLTRPFFSRRPDGMGMGLYYTNMVMELNQGRLLFPDAVEADLPKGFDGAILALVFSKEK